MTGDSALMYTCSLIEFIGRKRKLARADVVRSLGTRAIARIYGHADVLHSEPIGRVADEYIELARIPAGTFDNVASCRYDAPDYWEIGEVYERLVEDVCGEDPVEGIVEVYTSWMDAAISNYNSDLYYQPRDYLNEHPRLVYSVLYYFDYSAFKRHDDIPISQILCIISQ